MSKDKRHAATQISNWAVYLLVVLLATLAGFFAVYVNFGSDGNRISDAILTPRSRPAPSLPPASPATSGPLANLNRGAMATFLVHERPRPVPTISFNNARGDPILLKSWQGKVVLLNLWATWCLPCLKEMPALDAIKGTLGESDFDVVAISVDRGGIEKPRMFLDKIAARHIALYHEPSGALAPKLKAFGMPTTLLIDRKGREIGRLVGPAEWDSEDAVRLLRAAIGGSQAGH